VAKARVQSRRDHQHLCGRLAVGPEPDHVTKRPSVDDLVRHHEDPSLPELRRSGRKGHMVLHGFLSKWSTSCRGDTGDSASIPAASDPCHAHRSALHGPIEVEAHAWTPRGYRPPGGFVVAGGGIRVERGNSFGRRGVLENVRVLPAVHLDSPRARRGLLGLRVEPARWPRTHREPAFRRIPAATRWELPFVLPCR
jgi:hypothetical protein